MAKPSLSVNVNLPYYWTVSGITFQSTGTLPISVQTNSNNNNNNNNNKRRTKTKQKGIHKSIQSRCSG